MKKLLGLHCGRKLGSNEVLLKEALHAAKELGDIEVKMIRLLDLDIKPCKGCMVCVMGLSEGKSGDCVIKDDFAFLDDYMLDCDGIIISAPVFVVGPNGITKIITDRIGPSHDIIFRKESKEIREAQGANAKGKGPDERSFKNRVGGLISVGGAITPNWLAFGLPMLNLFTMPVQTKIVDQMEEIGMGRLMNIVLRPESIERAKKLGRNVGEALKMPFDKVKYVGPEGTCPVCHCNLLTVTSKNPVECPVCGISGTLRMEGDEIKVTFTEEEQARARLNIGGLIEHVHEIKDNLRVFFQRPDKDEIPARLEKYKTDEYESFVVPPPAK